MQKVVFVALALAVGCNEKKNAAPAQTPAPAATTTAAAKPADPATAANDYFKQKCVVCHGDHGAGDGPGAAALDPKPRAFADKEWQASVEDAHLRKIILEGGAAVGKSPGMPPNPDLKGKDELVNELIKKVRGFGK